MNRGRLVFAQLMHHLPLTTFRRCVIRYRGEFKVKSFSCLDQFLCMAFAQLTYRESLRDIEVCLRAQSSKLYHLGIRSAVARNTLANANAVRDWRIYADFAQSLIGIARPLYAQESFGVDLQETVYALDTTTIDLCLSVFPWAVFRTAKAAIKLHTLLDLRGNIPTFIHISDGKMHEVNILVFLTNNFVLPAFTITELYRCRWQVELFFKWIKQHLRIKAFYGTSENSVKSQIWIAVSAYVLVAIVKKRLHLSASLYEILQILSLTMFEKIPLDQLLAQIAEGDKYLAPDNQLLLFD